MISRLINPHFGISAAFRRMTVPLMDIALDLPVNGGAIMYLEGGSTA